jgi:hypothetical protein
VHVLNKDISSGFESVVGTERTTPQRLHMIGEVILKILLSLKKGYAN